MKGCTRLVGIFALAVAASSVRAESASIDNEQWERKATEVYQQVMSPFCPGRSLNDCPSSKAQELKVEMLTKLRAGTPAPEILEDVFARFGDQYRAIPKSEGFGRMVWLAPIGFLVLGGFAAALMSSRRRQNVTPGAVGGLSPDLEEELRKELDSID